MNEPDTISLATFLKQVAGKLEQEHPRLSQTDADVGRLFGELRARGFTRTPDEFMSGDRAGRPAYVGPAIAVYFRACADELERR